MTYHCEDCIYLQQEEHPEGDSYTCKIDCKKIDFDPTTKTPCVGFHPEGYIKALNADSVTRDIE